MRTSRYLTALVCLVSLFWWQPAIAQDFSEQRGQFSVGTLSFTPSTLLLFGHDTNLIRAVGAAPGSEVFDVAQIEAWWKPGRLRMSGAFAFESERELRSAGTTSWNNAEELNVYTLTGRIRPSFSFNRHNHYAPPSDFSGYEAGLKSRRIETQAEGRLAVLVGARTQFVTSARLTSIAYDADARFQNVSLQDNLNKTGRVVGASLEHTLTRQTTLFELAEIGQDRYERTPLRNGIPSFVGAGARAKSAALLEGSAFIGWRMYRSKTSVLDNYSGLNWQANIAVSRPRFSLLLDARRDFYPSYSAAFGQYVSRGGSLYVSGHASTHVEVFATASRFGTGYVAAGGAVVGHHARTGAGAAYRFSRMLVGATGELYAQRGVGAFHGRRITAYLQVGSGTIRRLDRPLPGER